MRTTPLFAALAAMLTVGCAAGVRNPEVTPADLSALEARQAGHPRDADVLTDVGVAFYQAKSYTRARDVLLTALALRPDGFRAAAHLGLSYEGLGRFDEALAAYRRAQGMKASGAERRSVEERLVGLTRQRLAAEARRAVAEERTLAATPPVPNSIAVLPWTYLGTDPQLRPLERGLAHLVVTDLSKVSRLTLLERERVQVLTDELALASSARVESGTAARSGRLLGAADVIQGAIRETQGGELRLDANVVSAATAEVRASSTASDRLAQLFTMEKSLVFDLLDRMGITLTPGERRAVGERPTADLQAFLAFSGGLEAEDRGDFGTATRLFEAAVVRDPSFQAARDRAAHSTHSGKATRMTPARLSLVVGTRPGATGDDRRAAGTRGAQLAAALQTIAPTLAGRINRLQSRPGSVRSRLAEALRQDDPSRLTAIGQPTVTIPRP